MLFLIVLVAWIAFVSYVLRSVPKKNPAEYERQREYYREQHRTVGCRVTHMFGIPLILLTVPLLFLSWALAIGCFVFGWVLQ